MQYGGLQAFNEPSQGFLGREGVSIYSASRRYNSHILNSYIGLIYSSNEISSHPIQNYPTYKKPSGGIGKNMKKCVQYYHCYRSYFNFYCTCRQEGITCMILCNQQDSEASAYICAFYGRMPNRDQNATAMPRLRSSTVFWWAHETAGSVTGTLRRKKTERCHGLDLPLGCLDIYRMWLEMV